MKPKRLKAGDTIGVVASSEPITKDEMQEIERAVNLMKDIGINVKFGKYAYCNPTGYGETAKHKAYDINSMFADESISGIFCAMGGYNCNAVFDYLDFDIIKNNPKIICGYSDPTSLINVIYAKTGMITFHGPNFKTIASEETDYGYKQVINRFIKEDLKLGTNEDKFFSLKEGIAEGILVRWEFISFF